ncbi:MAG TPA: DUF308 domain-containing protein [Desulfobacterales bacterium]|nr:DUF308 domain-containing protein [Desulfobacterales bacterium]
MDWRASPAKLRALQAPNTVCPPFESAGFFGQIGIFVILEGILALVVAARRRGRGYGWLFGLEGVLGIVVGILLLANPGTGVLAVVWLIGLYAIVFGGLLTYLGLSLRRISA